MKTTMAYDLVGAGSYSAIIGDDWYHFRHGVFIKDRAKKLSKLPGVFIMAMRPATEEDIEYFNSIVGEKWTFFNNCFTVFVGWGRKWQR